MAEAGANRPPLFPVVSGGKMVENMRSALSRGLPQFKPCLPHDYVLSIAGGGPSLRDTYEEMEGYIATINGSLRFMLERPIIEGASYMCGVLDAGEHIADMLVADKRVRYYIASICDPSVFDKLKGCEVVLWHPTPSSTAAPEEARALLDKTPEWISVGGGSTMGLRWINLGYLLGFRKFRLHGMDSSFRGEATHAYADRADDKAWMIVDGRKTRPNFVKQIEDFFEMLAMFRRAGIDLDIEVFGDGLLQDRWHQC